MLKLTLAALLSTGIVSLMNEETVSATNLESVTRLQGANRFETAALISQKGFDKADTIFIANAREFADALAGVPLAYQKDAPILLAQGNRLNGAIVEEINRLGASKAVILGGEAAVNTNLEGHLTSLGLKTTRLAGANRFETSVAIAEELENYVESSEAIFVDGFQFADAMSIAPFAAQEGMPIFLTRTNSLSVKEAAAQFDSTIIVGGENAVSKTVESSLNNPTRIAGTDRYNTNVAVMDYFGVSSNQFFLSTGLEFADALTGSVLAAKNGSAVGLVRNNISTELNQFITENNFYQFTIFGGQNAINDRTQAALPSVSTMNDNHAKAVVNGIARQAQDSLPSYRSNTTFISNMSHYFIDKVANPDFHKVSDRYIEIHQRQGVHILSTVLGEVKEFEQISPYEYRVVFDLTDSILHSAANRPFDHISTHRYTAIMRPEQIDRGRSVSAYDRNEVLSIVSFEDIEKVYDSRD